MPKISLGVSVFQRLISAISAAFVLAMVATAAHATTTLTVTLSSGPSLGRIVEGTSTTVFTVTPTNSMSQSPSNLTPGAALALPIASDGAPSNFPLVVGVSCSSTTGQGCANTFTITLSGGTTTTPSFSTNSFTLGTTSGLSGLSVAPGATINNNGQFTFTLTNAASGNGKTGNGSFNLGTAVSLGGSSGVGKAIWTITVTASTPG